MVPKDRFFFLPAERRALLLILSRWRHANVLGPRLTHRIGNRHPIPPIPRPRNFLRRVEVYLWKDFFLLLLSLKRKRRKKSWLTFLTSFQLFRTFSTFSTMMSLDHAKLPTEATTTGGATITPRTPSCDHAINGRCDCIRRGHHHHVFHLSLSFFLH